MDFRKIYMLDEQNIMAAFYPNRCGYPTKMSICRYAIHYDFNVRGGA